MGPVTPSQVVVVPEIIRHAAGNVICSVPEVVVLSEYVVFALAVNVPVTCRDPVTGAGGQFKPANVRSRLPLTFRHDDITVHVPGKLPPQGDTLEQDDPLPPPCPLPELPPVPDWPPELELHAPEMMPRAIAMARAADWTFIER